MPTAYKLFRVKKSDPGKLFPLFVLANEEVPVGEWLEAQEGDLLPSGKVRSRLGPLAFRPGWHLSDIPLAVHIGKKGEDGTIQYMCPDHVWCECEYSDAVDYQEEANANGTKGSKFDPKMAYLQKIPKNGCYRYKTSPMMLGTWIIAGEIRITRILSDEEVADICRANGYEPMPRWQDK